MSQPFRATIIGCGIIATEYAATLAASTTVTVTACADIRQETATGLLVRACDRTGVPGYDLPPCC